MESTKARIQGVAQAIYQAVLEKIPKDVPVEPLQSDEEVEGVFAVFFTSKGNRGLAVGVLHEDEVLSYLGEVVRAKMKVVSEGKNIVSSEDVAQVQRESKRMDYSA